MAAEFVRERQATLQVIADFSLETWQRRVRHSIFGLSTMLEMAYFTAQHDRLHLKPTLSNHWTLQINVTKSM